MNDLLTNLIQKQKVEIRKIISKAYVPRQLGTDLLSGLNSDLIKVIVGPRRAGKSSLALQVLKDKNFVYLNFEDESLNFKLTTDHILECFENIAPKYDYIIFDEIQLLPKWEHFINRLHRLGKNIIITGSNSKLLSSELSSSLTGRYLEYQLLPFSYLEYLTAKSEQASLDTFNAYLTSGGFPSIVTEQYIKPEFLVALWDSIILKDFVQRYKIRRIAELKALLHLILVGMSTRSSARSLERALNNQLSHNTINKYLNWSEGAYLACTLQNYSFKARERVNSEKKMYLYDNGFYTSQQTSSNKDYGKLLENYFFVELCRSGLIPNINLFSYKTKSGYEVDFYTSPASQQAKLIQVAFSATATKTKDREIRSLIQASSELNVKNLFLVTCDESRQILNFDGLKINVVPAWEWSI